mgnify:CR=1 FL=1
MTSNNDAALGSLFFLILVVWGFASWFTHLFVCFSEGAWGFLVAGALFFPIANIHGTGLWFGWW